MKFITALTTGLFATAVSSLALPAPDAEPEPLPEALASMTDVQIIKYTVKDWYADTAIVSKFLDDVVDKNIRFRSNLGYHKAATIAWLAEYSSTAPTYGNKAILDSYLANMGNGSNGSNGSNGTVNNNGTWTGGNSYGENVKTWLAQLKEMNWVKDAAAIKALVTKINADRCKYVLPAIDGYFQAAAVIVGSFNPSKPDTSIAGMRAVRAKACGATVKRDEEVEGELVLEDIVLE